MEQDLKVAKQLIEYKEQLDFEIDLEKYNSIYLFATENIWGFLQKIQLNNDFLFEKKNILTVCSSGDQILNLLLLDVSTIESYDINIFTKYFFYLKAAAIESLSYQEFLTFFFPSPLHKNNVFLESLFTKLEPNIRNKEAQIFWHYLFFKYGGKKLYDSPLFVPNYYSKNTYLACNNYLQTETNYNKLKLKLKSFHFQFYHLNIFKSISSLNNKKYDFIYLSNIMDRLEALSELDYIKKVKNILLSFQNCLVTGGRIAICYLYCYMDDYWYDIPDGKLKSKLIRQKYFKEGYQCVDFPGISNLKGRLYKDRDALLLTKKSKEGSYDKNRKFKIK